jgi:hypothetical protein
MKSGRGFHESCNEVYVKAFCEEMSTAELRNGALKYTKEEIDDLFPPQHWEFTKSPWHYGLLVQIYRRDPQLALDVAAVMKDPTNVPVSRAVLRRNAQEKARQMIDATPSPPTDCSVLTLSNSSFVTPSMNVCSSVAMHATTSGAHTDRRLTWTRVIASKAHADYQYCKAHGKNGRVGKANGSFGENAIRDWRQPLRQSSSLSFCGPPNFLSLRQCCQYH